jgi:hypothetical protein
MFITSSWDTFPDLTCCRNRNRAAFHAFHDGEFVVFVVTAFPDKGIHSPIGNVHDPELLCSPRGDAEMGTE